MTMEHYMVGQLLRTAVTNAGNSRTLFTWKNGIEALWKKKAASWFSAQTPERITANETSRTRLESLRKAFEADDYDTMAGIIKHLDWEIDAEARKQLADWIETGELVLVQENGTRKLRRRGYLVYCECGC